MGTAGTFGPEPPDRRRTLASIPRLFDPEAGAEGWPMMRRELIQTALTAWREVEQRPVRRAAVDHEPVAP